MCVGVCGSAIRLSGPGVSAEPSSANFKLLVLLTNVRGLRQAAAELSKRACEFKPDLIGLVETHLPLDALSGLIP